MVSALAQLVVLWLNNFTPKSGVSDIYSPRQIVLGTKLDMKKHCKIEFGAYAQVFVDASITNTMRERTEGCICLGPVDNLQGSVYFMKLSTGKVVVRRQFTELPLTDEVISQVNELGEKDSVPPFLSFQDIQDDPAKKDEFFQKKMMKKTQYLIPMTMLLKMILPLPVATSQEWIWELQMTHFSNPKTQITPMTPTIRTNHTTLITTSRTKIPFLTTKGTGSKNLTTKRRFLALTLMCGRPNWRRL